MKPTLHHALAAMLVIGLCGCTNPADELQPVMPTVTPLSGAALREALATSSDEQWQSIADQWPEAVRPEVEPVRLTHPSDHGMSQVECLLAKGWPAELRGRYRTQVGLREGATDLDLEIAQYECAVMYPLAPIIGEPLLPEHLKYRYEHIVHTQIPCLEAHGVTVPSPPSFQQYLDEGGRFDAWNAASATGVNPSLSVETLWAAFDQCLPISAEEVEYEANLPRTVF